MLIDGEKYACEACVRGHRVSSCNHNERPLQHINKKGRPVSQCPHCRGLRKSRSSHVKCECGDKPGCGTGDKHDPKADSHSCSCMAGQRCSCALKKEHLEAVPENPMPARARSRANTDSRKPRLSPTYSDPTIMQFVNGHHKPAHRHNHTSHDYTPYRIPRPHSIHGPSGLIHQSLDDFPLSDSTAKLSSLFPDGLSSLQQEDQRLVRSAQGSPGLNPLAKFDLFNQLPPLDSSYTAYNTSLTSSPAADDYNQNYQNFDNYTTSAEDQAPLSAPLSGPSYSSWTALDLPLDGGAFASASSQPPSYASLDQSHLSRPGMTSASSADVSEAGDFAAQGIPSPGFAEGSPYIPTPPENAVGGNFNMSQESFPAPAASPALNTNFETSSIESFVPQANTSPFDPTDLSIKPDPETFQGHGLTVKEAQKLAHPGLASSSMDMPPAASPMTAAPTSDPLWASTYRGTEGVNGFQSDQAYQDPNWMR